MLLACCGGHHIPRLDIAVHQAMVVQVSEAPEDLQSLYSARYWNT